MRDAMRRRALAVVVGALLFVHVWPPRGGPEPLVLGVLPWDLAVHVAWMLAAALVVVWMTTPASWRDDPDGDR